MAGAAFGRTSLFSGRVPRRRDSFPLTEDIKEKTRVKARALYMVVMDVNSFKMMKL